MRSSIFSITTLALLCSFMNSAYAGSGSWSYWRSYSSSSSSSSSGYYSSSSSSGSYYSGGGCGGSYSTCPSFDIEGFFFDYDPTSHNLSISLKSEFDLVSGKVKKKYTYNDYYYAGDLALSFNGVATGPTPDQIAESYEYAIDFGKFTADKDQNAVDAGNPVTVGEDLAGLYEVSQWNNNIVDPDGSPFAVDEGVLLKDLVANDAVYEDGWYWRTVTFNISGLVSDANNFTVDAHWTTSCGNDFINGSDTVVAQNAIPEPSSLVLFAMGPLFLVAQGYRRRKTDLHS